jgi:RES domain-containing protein
MRKARAVKFQGIGFRNVWHQFANKKDIVSTKGSLKAGGRYNIATSFGVLYLSCDVHTCIKELEYAAEYDKVDIEEKLPRTFAGVKVELTKVLDLTDAEVRRTLGVPRKILLKTDWAKENSKGYEAPTQLIGRMAKEEGFEALLVPSARWSGKNLDLLDDGNLLKRVLVVNINTLIAKKRVARMPRSK